MTRINVGCLPKLLVDEHLRGEYHEMPRVESQLFRSIVRGTVAAVLRRVPQTFCLNKGHQTFFVPRGRYMERRFRAVKAEMLARGFNAQLDFRKRAWEIRDDLFRDYQPTRVDVLLMLDRLHKMMPENPTYYRKPISQEEGRRMLKDIPLERISV